ncbi:MAG: hypothetical protein AB9891_02120 [Anaerolineaceae bacterium]
MDYHAWLILEKSLGVLDYGNIYNSTVANSTESFRLASAANRLWIRIKGRLEHGKKELDPKKAAQNEGRCHAC